MSSRAVQETIGFAPAPVPTPRNAKGISMPKTVKQSQFAGKGIAIVLSLFASTATHAQYIVTEGKGYVLCERLAAHLNRLTENGKAKRLWRFYDPDPQVVPYPKAQSDLTRELLSFPGFKRPPFSEVKLEEIRGLIELMGELDALRFDIGTDYGKGEASNARYVADRKAGTLPSSVLDKFKPKGQQLYNKLEQGKARVFRLSGRDSPVSPGTLLQIEYDDYKGEPVSLLRFVSDDLTELWPRSNSFDWPWPSKYLVLWAGGYYTISGNANEFDVESRTDGQNPHLCRIGNVYRPPNAR